MISYPRFLKGNLKVSEDVFAVKLKKGEKYYLPREYHMTPVKGAWSTEEDGALLAEEESIFVVAPKIVKDSGYTLKGGEWSQIKGGGNFYFHVVPEGALALAVSDDASYVIKDNCVGAFSGDLTVCAEPSAECIVILQYIYGGNK